MVQELINPEYRYSPEQIERIVTEYFKYSQPGDPGFMALADFVTLEQNAALQQSLRIEALRQGSKFPPLPEDDDLTKAYETQTLINQEIHTNLSKVKGFYHAYYFPDEYSSRLKLHTKLLAARYLHEYQEATTNRQFIEMKYCQEHRLEPNFVTTTVDYRQSILVQALMEQQIRNRRFGTSFYDTEYDKIEALQLDLTQVYPDTGSPGPVTRATIFFSDLLNVLYHQSPLT